MPEGLPTDARNIRLAEEDGTVYASWKGGAIDDPSCSVDDAASIPSFPSLVFQEQHDPSGDVEQCDFGKQASDDGITDVWKSMR